MVIAAELHADLAPMMGLDRTEAVLLERVGQALRPAFPGIAKACTKVLTSHASTAAVLTGGRPQVERLEAHLLRWLQELFCGEYGSAYFERRAQIGRTHVRIGLEQRYMFVAMGFLRAALQQALERSDVSPDLRARARRSIDRVCELDLALMVESYRDAHVDELRSTVRLATLGQLVASIGHDLRNPLAVMETSVHLLARHVGEDDDALRHLERIRGQVKISGSIINDLLDLVREKPLVRGPASLQEITRLAISLVPPRSGVSIESDVCDDFPQVRVDPGQIRQLLTNLLQNAQHAVASTGAKGSVHVVARIDGTSLRLRVEDTGPGLSPETLQHLFEPFFTSRPQGTGLGLALCEKIAMRHGGVISGQNRPEGGSLFEVLLPDVLGAPVNSA